MMIVVCCGIERLGFVDELLSRHIPGMSLFTQLRTWSVLKAVQGLSLLYSAKAKSKLATTTNALDVALDRFLPYLLWR
jgi:hypothetical protein